MWKKTCNWFGVFGKCRHMYARARMAWLALTSGNRRDQLANAFVCMSCKPSAPPILSNQISCIGLVSSKDNNKLLSVGGYIKRITWAWVSKWGHVCRGYGLWEEVGYMDNPAKKDCQLVSKSVLNNFTADVLISQPVIYPQIGKPECWKRFGDGGWNISVGETYRRSPVRVSWVKMESMGNSRRPCVSSTWVLDHHGSANG